MTEAQAELEAILARFDPLDMTPQAMQEEFWSLDMALQGSTIRRDQWDRFRALVTTITLLEGSLQWGEYILLHARSLWRKSAHYDGAE